MINDVQPSVAMDGVGFSYGRVPLLGQIDLEVVPGQSVAIMGKTGAGKSTLLGLLTALLRPTKGRVLLSGNDLATLPARRLAAVRRKQIGVVYQRGELLPLLTAVENVALPALLDGVKYDKATARATGLLEKLGVPIDSRPAATLSGGETQRAGLARALINNPAVIIADEPTGALDQETSTEVADLLFSPDLLRDRALVVVTHSSTLAQRAQRTFELVEGQLRAGVRSTEMIGL